MLAFSKAQMELKKIYFERQQEIDNLPSFEDLVDGGEQLGSNVDGVTSLS